jgi:hypothetical protein
MMLTTLCANSTNNFKLGDDTTCSYLRADVLNSLFSAGFKICKQATSNHQLEATAGTE